MTIQYNDGRTSITVEVVRSEEFETYLADNKHLSQPLPGAYAPQASTLVTSAHFLVRDSYEHGVFDGLLYDQLQYEHYESVAQMLDDEELERGEIEDLHLNSFIKPDMRGLMRERTISDKKLNGWFRNKGNKARRAKRNHKDVLITKFLNGVRRRPSQRRELATAFI